MFPPQLEQKYITNTKTLYPMGCSWQIPIHQERSATWVLLCYLSCFLQF